MRPDWNCGSAYRKTAKQFRVVFGSRRERSNGAESEQQHNVSNHRKGSPPVSKEDWGADFAIVAQVEPLRWRLVARKPSQASRMPAAFVDRRA